MAINIRKEQALCIATVALAAWLYSSMGDAGSVKRRNPTPREVTSASALEPILVDPAGAPKNMREVFVEPSESRPLEPRQDLPFPAMQSLPVAVLPLPIGQRPGALHGLRMRIAKAEAAAGQGNGDNPEPPAGQDPVAGTEGDDHSLRYDALIRVNQPRQVYWGLFLGDEKQKFELHLNKARLRAGVTFRFQWIEPKTGKRLGEGEWLVKGEEVKELRLAKTLRNEIGLAAHRLIPAGHNVTQQRDFILYLIQQARKEAWVFDLAMERAKAYQKFATPKEEGLLYIAKVLYAQGDLPAAWRLFKNIDQDLQGSSFQMRGLGLVEAQLGLDKLAEQHLRQAVAINDPIDPRNFAALAMFLLDQGRAEEAVVFADQAESFKGRRQPTLDEKIWFHDLKVRAHLAVGNLEVAEQAKYTGAISDPRLAELARYQSASVAYAKREFDAALDEFQKCAQSGLVPDAQLGIAACKFAKGDFAGALADFAKVADDNPKLRHLALAGGGLVLGHTEGEAANALERLDAALVANPIHAYSLYLQGRQRRLNGDLQGAVAALKKALRRQDDFIEALAELTQTYYQIYRQDDDTAALISAIRYVDRTVELDQKQGAKDPLLLELQGKIHFEARDVRDARKAFTAGAAAGSKFSQVGLGLLDYVSKRSDRCEERFNKMLRDEPRGAPIRVHVEKLLGLMQDHANKEQVVDNFAYTQKTKNWIEGQNGARPRFKDGEVHIKGKLRTANRPVFLRRTLKGAGRFVELSLDMLVEGAAGNTTFAGVQIGIPGRGANPSRFQVRVGVDERGKLVLERLDGRKTIEPRRFDDIDVAPGQWHTMRLLAVDDPKNPKGNVLFLRVLFDGQLVAEERLQSLRRSATTSTDFNTELRVEGRVGLPVDVSFRRYRRVQIKG